MQMFNPTWLPPLNAHEHFTIRVSAHQIPTSLSSPPPPPGYLSINSEVSLLFFAALDISHSLHGLSLSKSFLIHQLHLRNSNLIVELQIQFPLEKIIIWEWEAIGGPRLVKHLKDEGEVEGALKDFLSGLAIGPSGAAMRLRVEKMVQVPVSEFRQWNRWYEHNAKASERFETDYAAAISRPRSSIELVEEVLGGFRPLPFGSVKDFLDEEVEEEMDDDENDDKEDDNNETEMKLDEEVESNDNENDDNKETEMKLDEEVESREACPLCGHKV